MCLAEVTIMFIFTIRPFVLNKIHHIFFLYAFWKLETFKPLYPSIKKERSDIWAQWLSGRVLDSRPNDCGFESHRRHCVVVLKQDTFILA